MVRFLFGFCSLLFMECFSNGPSEKEIQFSLDRVSFETEIISDLPLYEDLNIFLESNLDTIMNYPGRNTDIEEYGYMYLNFKEDIQSNMQIPVFLKPTLDSLLSNIGRSNIESISIFNDRTIKFGIKYIFMGNDINIDHELVWGQRPRRFDGSEFEKFKDSIVDKNCTYRIGIWVDWGF